VVTDYTVSNVAYFREALQKFRLVMINFGC